MDAADNLLHNKLTPQKLTPRKTTYLACPSQSRGRARGSGDRVMEPNIPRHILPPSRPAPPPPSPTPRRQYQRAHNENLKEVDEESKNDESRDQASKIWAKIRRYSTGLSSHQGRSSSSSTADSVTASITLPFTVGCTTDSRALRGRKTAVDSGNVHIAQRQRLVGMSPKTSLTDRTNLAMLDDAVCSFQRRVPKNSGKGRQGSGRWSIGNWWG